MSGGSFWEFEEEEEGEFYGSDYYRESEEEERKSEEEEEEERESEEEGEFYDDYNREYYANSSSTEEETDVVDKEDIEWDTEEEKEMENIILSNKSSLEIDYNQIKSFSSDIADFLVCSPKPVLLVMQQVVARKLVFATGRNRNQDVYVRITELPFYNRITDLSISDALKMVRTGGVVAGLSDHRSIAFRKYMYYCGKCKENFGPYHNSYIVPVCRCPTCESRGRLKLKRGKIFYKNYQAVSLKEDRETVADCVVIMLNDHIDFAKLGDHIEVTGLFIDNYAYSLAVEANYVKLLSSENKFTKDDLEKIDKLSKDPNIGKLIIKSLATSINYGHEDVKTALALSMFSGQLESVGKLHRRKDVNVLLIGYPSTVKSQIREYVERTGQRFVYTTGKGFSEVGLIGAVRSGSYPILQAGPLVYADMGICLIDDFEKMSEQDSGNIDEALEQQKISRSWDGGVKTLDARCSVIAAANPSGERYDSFKSFYEQDEVNPELIHGEKYNAADPEIIPSDLLQKYLTFAKLNVSPHLKAENFQELEQLYPELRNGELLRKAACDHHHLEAVIRMSEAHAKMHLRSDVIKEDVEMAIQVMLNTCSSQQ
ncbi:hypothetical protein RD792_015344 [Penstemon davidsonii]|uniref:DNA helicase n=1 Tax=Penstemon davidsonii TaxID=160366 RepID=A0ABR0CRS1_9LAMI|nr:hypothetical protein RD792_015344 [Penstemon davidsonii]